MKVILIAGGSGSGKSSASIEIYKRFPERVALIHFDDYMKKRAEAPLCDGLQNMEHPDVMRFDDVVHDIEKLKNSESFEIETRSEVFNPEYSTTKTKKRIVVEPRPIVILEGYLALYDKRLRDMADYKIFLELDSDTRMKRRTKFLDDEYKEKVLLPMHDLYVEPTKSYADLVIDVSRKGVEEVRDAIIQFCGIK